MTLHGFGVWYLSIQAVMIRCVVQTIDDPEYYDLKRDGRRDLAQILPFFPDPDYTAIFNYKKMVCVFDELLVLLFCDRISCSAIAIQSSGTTPKIRLKNYLILMGNQKCYQTAPLQKCTPLDVL